MSGVKALRSYVETVLSWVKSMNVALVVLAAVLAGCASEGRSYTGGNMQETLEVEILPNTSKMFVYRLRTPEDRMPDGVRVDHGGAFGQGRGEGRGGIDISRSTQQNLHANAAYVVEHMGYCREGFLELDSSMSRFNLWIKGECKEGATEADIQKFGTKQTLPVKLTN